MVLTEDIAVARGATFADATQLKVTRDKAESMIAEFARYHGAMWEDARLLGEWGLLRSDAWQRMFNARIGFDRGALVGMRMLADIVPAQLHDRRSEIRTGLMRSLEHSVSGPLTLLHQDVHPNNWFALPDDSLHLYDWQGIGAGGWALDLSYALSAALDIEDRRAWKRDLIALYVDQLANAGGRPPTVDEAFLAWPTGSRCSGDLSTGRTPTWWAGSRSCNPTRTSGRLSNELLRQWWTSNHSTA
jgi:hypothetical protein